MSFGPVVAGAGFAAEGNLVGDVAETASAAVAGKIK